MFVQRSLSCFCVLTVSGCTRTHSCGAHRNLYDHEYYYGREVYALYFLLYITHRFAINISCSLHPSHVLPLAIVVLASRF
ncbi:hypothetical protein B0H21DRAFT_743295 [Amylocystis lapponica]|nr:hypothetical protein B0H21DRAFT_743295 [Amylocystis lapponica]